MPFLAPLPASLVVDNKGPGITATICAVTALETLFCAARIYSRGRRLGRLHLDDYLILLAVAMGWGSAAFSILAVQSGNGKHFAILTQEQKSGAILWTMVGFCLGILSSGIPKLTMAFLLTWVFSPSRIHNILLWCLATICLLGHLVCVIVLFGRCIPTRSLWDFDVTPDSCFSVWILVDYAIYAGIFSACIDLYLAIYPVAVLLTLQMRWTKKLALSAAFGVRSVATIVAVYKTTRLPGLASQDFSYDTSDLVVWTAIEGATTIIAACIPLLKPLVKIGKWRIAGNLTSSRRACNPVIELSIRRNPVRDPNGLTVLDERSDGSELSILGDEGPDQGRPSCSGGSLRDSRNVCTQTHPATISQVEE